MSRIVVTLNDYTEDIQAHLNEYLFETLMEDMLLEFLRSYMTAAKSKSTKFKMPEAIEQIRNDVRLAYGFFSQYIAGDVVQEYFRIFEMVLALLSAYKPNFSAVLDNFMLVYWDTPNWSVLMIALLTLGLLKH